jgi:hypothetical protein
LVVVTRIPGQLGNRLFQFAHLAANALENDYIVVNPTLRGYASLLQQFAAAPFVVLRRGKAIGQKLITFLSLGPTNLRILRELSYILIRGTCKRVVSLGWLNSPFHAVVRVSRNRPLWMGDESWKKIVQRRPVVLLDGYYAYDRDALAKHRESILCLLKPLGGYMDTAARFVSSIRSTSNVVIGLHVRHGDYASWRGGRFFFSWEEYAEIARRSRKLFAEQSVRFILFSNVSFQKAAFEGIDVVPGPGHLMEDLCALSLCDYIIGPPSSFSRWAAFSGDIPICILDRADMVITMDSFRSVLESPWLTHSSL